MTTENTSKFWIRNSITIKLVLIGVLILVLLVPAGMIKRLIQERNSLRNSAIQEVSYKWGNPQTLGGPILTVPYKTYYKKGEDIIEEVQYAHFLPEDLKIDGTVQPEQRKRGIYHVVVYKSDLNFKGRFKKPDLSTWKISDNNVLWDQASLSVLIPDMRGIKKAVKIQWNRKEYDVNPGIIFHSQYSGVSTPIEIKEDTSYSFNFNLNLNGSEYLQFIPAGKQTEVNLSSNWKNPSFDGAFLPNDHSITEQGFEAKWNVLHLNRPFPQQWIGDSYNINTSSFGVKLLLPVDHYQKTERSVKYAIMFISLTFLIFFFTEILNKKRIHPIQYLLVGLGLSIFYTLLLSLSEHFSFNLAYLIASISIISLITAYSYSMLKNKRLTFIVAIVLVILYAFLFVILQLQDYALLLGSIGLFISLAIVMYLSRKVNWYSNLNNGNDISNMVS